MKKLVLAFLLLLVVGCVAAGLYIRSELRRPFPNTAATVVLDIPRGLGARDVVGLLQDKNVIHNRYIALAYILYSGQRHSLKAGEYLFDRPMTTPEVIGRLSSGSIYLHKFTVPEGLTLAGTATKWQEQGFGAAADFKAAAAASVGLIADLDPKATTVEGYLFPETYSFPTRTTARQAIQAMVHRFKSTLEILEKQVPRAQWPLELRETVILASLIESEAAEAEERTLIASVYLNRIQRNILLQCDPTVIYALQLADKYRGKLSLADLKYPSPYNTYVTPGLPPGPIMSPGLASLRAATDPAATKYIFFVRTENGRHTFTENLAAHNRAVAA
jgi:UPF0755 protein